MAEAFKGKEYLQSPYELVTEALRRRVEREKGKIDLNNGDSVTLRTGDVLWVPGRSSQNKTLMDKFTKDDLAKSLTDKGLVGTMHHSSEIVENLLSNIETALIDGYIVDLSRFGRFQIRNIPPATRRNPATGEQFRSSGRSKVAFKASAALTRRVQP